MKKIIIARFGKVFGLKGWIKVISFTTPKENIFKYKHWLIKKPGVSSEWTPLEIKEKKIQGVYLIVKLPDCANCEQAQHFVNTEIAVERHQMPNPKENEYYWADLEGMSVVNEQDINLGIVDHLFNNGANDVIFIKDPIQKKERLLPYIKHVIKRIDLENKIIYVDWDENF
jgi:16S rRNA processing protein RimM